MKKDDVALILSGFAGVFFVVYLLSIMLFPGENFCKTKQSEFVSISPVPMNETKIMFDAAEYYLNCSNGKTYHVAQNVLMTFQKEYFEVNPDIPEGGFAITPHFGGGQ